MTSDAPLLDLMEGRAARDAGIRLVLEHQDEEWKEAYRTAADAFLLELRPGDEFQGEDIRAWAIAGGLEQPRDPHAWSGMAGSVLTRWRKQGAIERTPGGGQAKAKKSHASWQQRYRVRG